MSLDLKIFPAYRAKSVTVTATTPATVAPLPGGQGVQGGQQIMVTNVGTDVAYIQTGDSNVDATATEGIPIVPGEKGVYSIASSDTHIAVFAASGAPDLIISQGSGV